MRADEAVLRWSICWRPAAPSSMISLMAKKTPPAPAPLPAVLSHGEGVTRLQEIVQRGNQLLQKVPTSVEIAAYKADLAVALNESLGSAHELTQRTLHEGPSALGLAFDREPDYVSFWHEELRTKNELLGVCIEHLKRLAAREKPLVPAQPEPTALSTVEGILHRFHSVALQLRNRRDGRPPLLMNDEYDVQYLLHALLLVSFRDVRPEEYGPSVAGGSPRLDFLLKEEKIVIEVKRTRSSLADREVGAELLADIARYQGHADCKTLVCFIYDPDGRVRNAAGLTHDLEKQSSPALKVRALVVPGH
jgi:hypothetical protein